jgi:rhamnose utilization protein RhaD (predicted bifunctional aldolase and dehydrogenase)
MKWIVVAMGCLLAAGSFDGALAVDAQRQAYDKMVEEATREADEYVQEKLKAQQEAAKESQSQQEAALDARIGAERERIEAEMDTVQGRGLSSTFTQGMKDNLLEQLHDQLNSLMSDPDAYFGGQ